MKTPHTLTDVRDGADLFERIRNGAGSFPPSFKKVAEYIVAHTQDVAFSPAARVASAAGVSESVVVRFAAELGYGGYPAMQQAAQAYVRSRLAPAARLESVPITSASTASEILRSVFSKDIENLRATAEYVPNEAVFARVVEVLLEAQRVYIVGFRGLRHLAGLMAFLLDMASLECILITHGDADGFHVASRIRKGDALVAFAFSRYTTATRNLVELARAREARTIVVCDTVMAPAARTADCVLQTATASSSFHNSYVAAVACINAIVAAISTKARARVTRRLREVDANLPDGYFDVL
jgi:DNA-binding MurR/RpiR family transcriptional regulator